MNDPSGRNIDYPRISVTDLCHERCLYCMPEGYHGWAQREDHLTADETVRTVEAATHLGFRKFRVTGREPLLRRDILTILARIRCLPGVQSLGVSTNATRLAPLIPALRWVGVDSRNISLDALDAELDGKIPGGDLSTVLVGIRAALHEKFPTLKLNCMLLRGLNETEYLPLIRLAVERKLPLRFIELMPLSRTSILADSHSLSSKELQRRLENPGALVPLSDFRPGHGPARYYQYRRNPAARPPCSAVLGFIGALRTADFCHTCHKLRLTADGKVRPCLGRAGEMDLRSVLRSGGDPAVIRRRCSARLCTTNRRSRVPAKLRAQSPHDGYRRIKCAVL